jgi:hypothetical protein
MSFLAGDATPGGGIGLQALDNDGLLAVAAFAVDAFGDAHQGDVDVAYFLDVAVDGSQFNVHQQVGECYLARVMHSTGEIAVLFLVGAQ